MEVFNNKLEMPKWVCGLAITLGAVALIVQAIVDIYQGVSADMNWPTWLTQAWQMSLPTGFALVFAAMGGGLLRMGGWKSVAAAVALFALVGGYLAYTASNSMDFIANQTVARTQTQIKQQTRAKDISEIKNKIALEERKEKQENLWRTYYTAKPQDKDKALSQIKEASQEAINLDQGPLEVVAVGVGDAANRYLGWRPEAIQEAKAFALPILLMFGKALGITLGFAFWPATAADRWRETLPGRLAPSAFSESDRKLSYEEARNDLLSMIATGARVGSQRELSERWGVGEGTVSKWMPRLKRETPIKTEMNGNKRAIVGVPHPAGANGKAAHA